MKRLMRILMYGIGAVCLIVLGLLFYVTKILPDVGPVPDITVDITDERVERGRYLANHVMLCMDCHATRDFSLFAGPPEPGTLGAGGERFDHSMGFPGVFISPNITPAALGDWTDGEIFHMITTGVNREGKAVFPVMPYHRYGTLDEEDIYAVIAYLRSLDPIVAEHERSKADFPVNLLLNTLPTAPSFSPMPPKNDPVEYGRYMIAAAACGDCHTKRDGPAYVGEPYAGGNEFQMPDGSVVRAVNLTPHETGLGAWTKEMFVERFKIYADSAYVPPAVAPGELQTIMPWLMYADMEREDLEAIYDYLQTLQPVDNPVIRFSAAE
ncbi:MAG: cytochrome C [Balneolaceae bacterium]